MRLHADAPPTPPASLPAPAGGACSGRRARPCAWAPGGPPRLAAPAPRRAMRAAVRLGVLFAWGLGALLPSSPVRAGEDDAPERLSTRYRRVARVTVPLSEISGWAPLPPRAGEGPRRFLTVVDEGAYHPEDATVRGALHVLTFDVGVDEAVTCTSSTAVTLRLGDHLPRIDPGWAGGPSVLDLEACVPLPGTEDLYLLAGERNPEDVTDGGANRLYVVRYPGRAESKVGWSDAVADLLAYLRLPDLADDAINDRLEGVVATPLGSGDAWRVFAFKERTNVEDRVPVYFPLVLGRGNRATAEDPASPGASPGFELGWLDGHAPRRLPALLPARTRLGAQADACRAPDGRVWVLDRWRREIHVANAPSAAQPLLEHVETLDLFDLVADAPGETDVREPGAPGSVHAGYGRQEAMAFDARGWLWLAADLGGGRPSVITALAPRDAPAPGAAPAHGTR